MTVTRREFVKALSIGGAAIALPAFFQALAKSSEGGARPNIVWLDSEDNCPDIIPYCPSLAHTPNLERFAREGAVYTNAYSPAPVCSPARSAYITGMYPTSIGAQNHRSHRRDYYPLKPPVKPMTEYFMEAGYFCTRGDFTDPNKRGKTDYNFSYDFDKIYDGTNWRKHAAGQPFFAQIYFHNTNRPYAPHDTEPNVSHRIDPDKDTTALFRRSSVVTGGLGVIFGILGSARSPYWASLTGTRKSRISR
jgi:uncharacterized sulfatase